MAFKSHWVKEVILTSETVSYFFFKKALNCRSLRSYLTSELFKSPCPLLPQYTGVITPALLVSAIGDAGVHGGARETAVLCRCRDGTVSWVVSFLRRLRSAEQQGHSCSSGRLSCSTLSANVRLWCARAVGGHLPSESVVVRLTRWGGRVPMPCAVFPSWPRWPRASVLGSWGSLNLLEDHMPSSVLAHLQRRTVVLICSRGHSEY